MQSLCDEIVTEEADWDLWLSGESWEHAAHLLRPLSDGALKIVATGVRQDTVEPVA